MRATVTFKIPIRLNDAPDGKRRWLDADGRPTLDEALAASFTFYRSPNMRERSDIEKLTHELAGGLRAWVQRMRACDGARDQVLARLTRQLWPTGRPEAEGEARAAQERMLDIAWNADDSDEKGAWATLSSTIARLEWAAKWQVLAVDVPTGWREIGDRDMDDGELTTVWNAWTMAHLEHDQGKRTPSGD